MTARPAAPRPRPVLCWRRWVSPERVDEVVARFPEPARLIVTAEGHRPRARVDGYPANAAEGRRWVRDHGGRLLRLPPTVWWRPQEPRAYPLRIGRRLLVVASEAQRAEWTRSHPDRIVLRVPAGLAFGTGEHATTRLCLREIARIAPVARALDAGCGSGILAIAAARLGCERVEGFDFDPDAVRIARENAEDNCARVTWRRSTIEAWRPRRAYHLVVANVFTDVLVRNATRLAGWLAPEGWLVLSGIRSNQAAAVRHAFSPLAHECTRTAEGWCCIVLRAPARGC